MLGMTPRGWFRDRLTLFREGLGRDLACWQDEGILYAGVDEGFENIC
jgi:hypothetical protein